MADDNGAFNQLLEPIPLIQSSYYNLPTQNGISFIFEYKNQRHWVKVLYLYSYDMFEAKSIAQFIVTCFILFGLI